MTEGLKRAAVYSLPPSLLKLCGRRRADTAKVLFEFLEGKNEGGAGVREVLKKFEAAYPYYSLIAKSGCLSDPFDDRVIKAYWLGGALLDRVETAALRRMIGRSFSKPDLLASRAAKELAAAIPAGVNPHHSFHVLCVGSITGVVEFDRRIRNQCLVMWGRVREKLGDKIKVIYHPLGQAGGEYFWRSEKEGFILWNRHRLPQIETGDWVSFHWGWVCQVLTREEKETLSKYTVANLRAANARRR